MVAVLLSLVMLFSFAACSDANGNDSTTTKKQTTAQATKTITVEVVSADETKKTFTIDTSEKYLRKALEQEKLIQGEEGEYGLYVKTVDGYTANDANKEWWAFYKDGEMLQTGVDLTPISDGDKFQVKLSTY